jgi:hypothetical protein
MPEDTSARGCTVLALEKLGWSTLRSDHFTSWNNTPYVSYRGLDGPRRRSGWVLKSLLASEFERPITQPVTNHWTACAIAAIMWLFSTFLNKQVINNVYVLLGISLASVYSLPTFRNHISVPSSKAGSRQSTSSLWRWNWYMVPKLRQTTYWCRGNTQKNIYNIQITAKAWNLEVINK